MYNNEIKKEYIQHKNPQGVSRQQFLNLTFSKSSVFEEKYNKDISEFTVEEILEFYKSLDVDSVEYLSSINAVYRLYSQWLNEKDPQNQNPNNFNTIVREQYLQCINYEKIHDKIITREKLLELIKTFYNARDSFIFLFLFEVGKGKDYSYITNAKFEDISGNTIKLCDGRVVEISNELILYARKANAEYDYYSASDDRIFPMRENGRIIKDAYNTSITDDQFVIGKRIYCAIVRALDYLGLGKKMSSSSITESGKIHMINKRAKELNMPTKEYVLSDYIKEVEKHYNCRIIRNRFVEKYSNYLV